jgi:ribonucleoside-diphosphate reductase alpha chain
MIRKHIKTINFPKRIFRKYVVQRFELREETQKILRSMPPPFGGDGFGELIFYRTYSRTKSDGSQENWSDCIIRVINGVFSIIKDYYVKNNLQRNEEYWQEYAAGMARYAHSMYWSPPGS